MYIFTQQTSQHMLPTWIHHLYFLLQKTAQTIQISLICESMHIHTWSTQILLWHTDEAFQYQKSGIMENFLDAYWCHQPETHCLSMGGSWLMWHVYLVLCFVVPYDVSAKQDGDRTLRINLWDLLTRRLSTLHAVHNNYTVHCHWKTLLIVHL